MLSRLRTTTDYLKYIDTENLDLFTNREILQTLIENYHQTKVEQARKEGYKEAQKELGEKIEKILKLEINNYINFVTEIADNTYTKTNKIFSESLRIVETRANFSFGTRRIRLLLIIDGDYAKEIEFATFLHNIEKEVFEKNKFFCEILYVNKNKTDLNSVSISIDFPLARNRKVKKAKHA